MEEEGCMGRRDDVGGEGVGGSPPALLCCYSGCGRGLVLVVAYVAVLMMIADGGCGEGKVMCRVSEGTRLMMMMRVSERVSE